MAKVTDKVAEKAPASGAITTLAGGALILPGFAMPKVARVGAGGGEYSDKYRTWLKALTLPEGADISADPVAIPVEIPDNIKEDEKEKALKEEARRIVNRVGNAAKGLKPRKFMTRRVQHEGKHYIGVWEVAPEAKPAEGSEPTAAAAE
jgi:hypothetical protein